MQKQVLRGIMKAPRRDIQFMLEHQGRPFRGRDLYEET